MSTTTASTRVAVIGGGITGLSAAYELTKNGHAVTLFESSDSFGGKVAESSIDGLTFPTGPDAFLARRPEVIELAEEVGLGSSLVSPTAGAARIYRNGELHPLPPNVLGIPATAELGATGLISPQGAERASAQIPDDPSVTDSDESVGSLVRRQMGDEVLEFLVDPLLGGINAGDSDRLSIVTGVPQIDALRRRDPILLHAAQQALKDAAQAAQKNGPQPVFRSIEGGLSRLVEQLVQKLEQSGLCELATNSSAVVERTSAGWRVAGADFDHIISTVSAFAAADMLDTISPNLSEMLHGIDYSSVALTVMTLPPNTLPVEPSISGVLVPRSLGLDVTAVSFASHKWPTLSVNGQQMLRVSTGRRTNDSWAGLDDDQLVARIERDLTEMFSTDVTASNAVVTRWMRSLPQYDVGHRDLIARIDASLTEIPGLQLTGSWRDGLGLPACVGAGRSAALAI